MGNDLYWMQTPKPLEDNTHGLYTYTWYFLKDLFGLKERDDLGGYELTKKNIPQLKTVLLTAQHTQCQELIEDINDLIIAIEKYDSITLVIHG